MRNIFTASIAMLLGLGMILSSWQGFERGTIASIQSKAAAFSRDAKGIKVTAKRYTGSESKDFLDRNLLRYGYQPIQITVENNSADAYLLSREGVSLPSASGRKVAMSVSKKSLPRSIGLKIASLFFAPFMVVSTVEGIYTLKTHAQMKKDYVAKGVRDKDESIAPYTVFHRVVFVPKNEMRDTMTVTLLSKKDKKDAISFIHSIEDSKEAVQLDKVE